MTDTNDTRPESTDTQTTATESTAFFTRRRVLKGATGAVGAGVLGGLGLWYGTQPALAASTYNETDGVVTVETNAGEVMDVRVAPVFTLDWTNFGGGADSFDFDITAEVDVASETVYSETGVSDASAIDIDSFTTDGLGVYNGSVEVDCASLSILGENITTGSFPTGVAEGTDETATVTLTLSATGNQTIGSAVDASDATHTFDVTVSNPVGSASAEITASNAEADGADSADETTTSP